MSIFPTTTSTRVIYPDTEFGRRHFTDWRPRPLQPRPSTKIFTFTHDAAQQQDPLIHGVSYTARSSRRFKCYNALAPARAVMDSSGYHSQQCKA